MGSELLFLISSIVIVIQCLLLGYRGYVYANNSNAKLFGALINSSVWSMFICWSLIIAVGHGVAFLPMPTWFAILVFNKDIVNNEAIIMLPSLIINPLLPIVSYHLVFFINRSCLKSSA